MGTVARTFGITVIHDVRPSHVHVLELMVATTLALSVWLESCTFRDYSAFCVRSTDVSAQSGATICGAMVLDSDGNEMPWLETYVSHPVVK